MSDETKARLIRIAVVLLIAVPLALGLRSAVLRQRREGWRDAGAIDADERDRLDANRRAHGLR